jgi:hypothetical protein
LIYLAEKQRSHGQRVYPSTKYVGISALLGALPFDIFRKAIDQTLEQLSER